MVEKQQEKLRAEGKAAKARPEAKSIPSKGHLGAQLVKSLRRVTVRSFFQHCKAHGSPYQTHNTLDCRRYDSNGNPLEAAAGNPAEFMKPYKKFGGNRSMAFMQTMFKAYVKANNKAGKFKKRKKHDYDSSDSSDSE